VEKDVQVASAELSLLNLPLGLHEGLPEEIYHRKHLGVVNNGALRKFREAPIKYHAWACAGGTDKETAALFLGKAFHRAILEHDKYVAEYVVPPDFGDCRTKENKTKRDAWKEAHEGRSHLLLDDAMAIEGMVASVFAHTAVGHIFSKNLGRNEVTALWRDEHGLLCKARADKWAASMGLILDLKSCQDASEKGFRADCFRYGYDYIVPHYIDGFRACGQDVKAYLFVSVEKEPPYLCQINMVDLEDEEAARRDISEQKQRFAKCLQENVWPGLPSGVCTVKIGRKKA
jgi:hypothetical protein